MEALDPHERPPNKIRNVYKRYQKMKIMDLDRDHDILDLDTKTSDLHKSKISIVNKLDRNLLAESFRKFAGSSLDLEEAQGSVPLYEHHDMPGLHMIPNLLPPEIQIILLSRLLHRDLSNPTHLTNIHTHYKLRYRPSPSDSFFHHDPTSQDPITIPIDPAIHKPLTISQLLNKKIRWMTLGGQYDWTAKQYPTSPPPDFPNDVKKLLGGLFPATRAEAAIVNLYSPGDTLSVHRDVAESCGTGLISLSLGCDGIFVIGHGAQERSPEGGEEEKVLAVRLKSGSAVYMTGESRFAWHGVPQIVKGTCPSYLQSWPAGSEEDGVDEFEPWRGWMESKRVNINVRQMW